MTRLAPYIAAAGAVLGLWWYIVSLNAEVDTQAAEIERQQINGQASENRVKNLKSDMERDNAVDDLSTEDLRTVPDRWMRE